MDDQRQYEIRGRRFDGPENSALVVISNPNARPGRNFPPQVRRPTGAGESDRDMLDYIRQEEQKLKLEKLKWRETNARIRSLDGVAVRPATKSSGSGMLTRSSAANDNLSRQSSIKKTPAEMKDSSVRTSSRVMSSGEKKVLNSRDMALVERKRIMEASKWLHKEQEDVRAQSRTTFGVLLKAFHVCVFSDVFVVGV